MTCLPRNLSALRVSRNVARAVAAGAFAVISVAGFAQTWRLQPSVTALTEFTDNVAFVSTGRTSDWVNQITPVLRLSERSAHTTLAGSIGLPVLLYTRTDQNDAVRPEVHLNGTAELYPQRFFVDASAQVSQQFVSPFGARPQNLVTATNNRATAQSYRVAPYIKGESDRGLRYELRDDNVWTNANGVSAVAGGRSYLNEIIGNLNSTPRPTGWEVNYDRAETRFSGQDSLLTEIGRAKLVWQPDPQWQIFASGGYENNEFVLESFSGPTYGAGFKWHPTDRTDVEAAWEHRFFGASYHARVDHRTPLTVWSITALRDITTYPQQFANFATGGDVNALLNAMFTSRFPDPVQRQTVVDQFIRDRGLPSVLSSPLDLISQQITLQQSVRASASILGARNSVLFTAFRARSEPIAGSEFLLTALSPSQTDNTQTGANIVWSYKLTPLYTIATSADWIRTVANDSSGRVTRQGTLQAILSAPISVLTTVFTGTRYQRLTSNVEDVVHETAVFFGISHMFK